MHGDVDSQTWSRLTRPKLKIRRQRDAGRISRQVWTGATRHPRTELSLSRASDGGLGGITVFRVFAQRLADVA